MKLKFILFTLTTSLLVLQMAGAATADSSEPAEFEVLTLEKKLQYMNLVQNQADQTAASLKGMLSQPVGVADTAAVMQQLHEELESVKQATGMLKSLTGELRSTKIESWNAQHEEVKVLLFKFMSQEALESVSDELAVVLEQIRQEFVLPIEVEAGV